MKIFLTLILLITNLSMNVHAKEFMLVSNNNEDCYIEGTLQDNLITGFGLCIDHYEKKYSDGTEHSYMYGKYESGKKIGLFLELRLSDYLTVTFSEYENNMRDGFLIDLNGENKYWIFQFENDIEQGLSLTNYPLFEQKNIYNYMVDGGSSAAYTISPDEIENFELGYTVFTKLIAETFGFADIKKLNSTEESFKVLGYKTLDIMENFLDTMCNKYEQEFCYQ
jgi:hypothetical protein